MKVTVGVAQLNSQDSLDENLSVMASYVAEAAQKGCRFISFPECSHYIGKGTKHIAEEIPGGKTVQFLAELAKKYNMWIHTGSLYERRPGVEKLYNTVVLINPQGEVCASYSKLHLFDVSITNGPSVRESDRMAAGSGVVTYDTKEIGHLGFGICYDMRFPEMFRLMALAGANILVIPANFTMMTGKDHWEVLLRARAIENHCYVLAPAQIGKKPLFEAYGKSMIIDPWGTVVAQASDRPGLIVADVDLDYVQAIREQVGTLSNRRTDVYTLKDNKKQI